MGLLEGVHAEVLRKDKDCRDVGYRASGNSVFLHGVRFEPLRGGRGRWARVCLGASHVSGAGRGN